MTMSHETLLDFFAGFANARGEFLVFDDGFRTRSFSYAQIVTASRAFAGRLDSAGFTKGDHVMLWGENRPEWIVAFWGCVLRGIVAVPIDYRSSGEFLERVRAIVGARLVLSGDDVERHPLAPDAAVWPLADLLRDPAGAAPALPPVSITRDDVVEIMFTSGATAEPKGVVITHRNLLANIVPIETEVRKYRKWGTPFFPIRFLNLLPLSHLFGQSLATFVPPMLAGTVIFMRGYNPHDISRLLRTRRVSVLVCVPKMLDVLREYVLRAAASAAGASAEPIRWWHRWWQHRDVHRLFGWKFWSFVVGAAPLEGELEEFWSRLGYLVIQGYGLTETAPIVTLNHPFSSRKGSVGKPIPGVEVKLAPDGEILVRGDNVTQGYFGAADAAGVFEDGWLHTGDIGGVDDDGRVYIRGRKKEMIVTPEGLNVFPEDVERVLLRVPGVRDAAVVGRTQGGEERVHAVLIPAPGTDADAIIRAANGELSEHQRIRGVSIWPQDALPRTEGTRKLKRRQVKSWVEAGSVAEPASPLTRDSSVDTILRRFAHGAREIDDQTALETLGLTSLERVELLMALEERFDVTLDETVFGSARTVGDLRAALAASQGDATSPPGHVAGAGTATGTVHAPAAPAEVVEFPRWNRGRLARAIRRVSYPTWLLPLARAFVWLEVEGRDRLDAVRGPVVFAANHQSHLDAPAILAALPPRFRRRVAIAMAKEFFKAHFFPDQYGRKAQFTNSLNYYLAALFFNAFPLPQREAGARDTLRYVGELASEGYSLLIFPEGKRTDHGEIHPFRPGVGMMAARLDLPVVPVRLEGLDRILHHSWHMARPGRARVSFGPPMRLTGDDFAALAGQVENVVRNL